MPCQRQGREGEVHNASVGQCSGARRCASYGRAAQRLNNGRPQDGAMRGNNGGAIRRRVMNARLGGW